MFGLPEFPTRRAARWDRKYPGPPEHSLTLLTKPPYSKGLPSNSRIEPVHVDGGVGVALEEVVVVTLYSPATDRLSLVRKVLIVVTLEKCFAGKLRRECKWRAFVRLAIKELQIDCRVRLDVRAHVSRTA
jgi:hypothetical protein